MGVSKKRGMIDQQIKTKTNKQRRKKHLENRLKKKKELKKV